MAEQNTAVHERRLAIELGKQLGNEQDAIVGASADVDVRGSENISLSRNQLYRGIGFLFRRSRVRREGQFWLYELKHVALWKELSGSSGLFWLIIMATNIIRQIRKTSAETRKSGRNEEKK